MARRGAASGTMQVKEQPKDGPKGTQAVRVTARETAKGSPSGARRAGANESTLGVGMTESNARIIADKKTGTSGLIRYAHAGYVMKKTLASGLADAFSQLIPAWKPSATHSFLPTISERGASAGPICVAK